MSFAQTITINQSREMMQNFELSSHLNYTLAKISQLLKADFSLIFRFKYETTSMLNRSLSSRKIKDCPEGEAELVAQWSKNSHSHGDSNKYCFKIGESPLCQTAWQNAEYNHQPLLIHNKKELLRKTDLEDPSLLFEVESRFSLLMVPVFGTNDFNNSLPSVLGFIIFQQNQLRVWSESEIELAQWAAMQASLAIIHHETLAKVQDLHEQRRVQTNNVTSGLQKFLFQKKEEIIDDLRRTNHIKDQFISRLSDELKNPLTSMKIAITNLKTMLHKDVEPQKIERAINILETECSKEIALVNQLLSLEQLQNHKVSLQLQKFDLRFLVDDVVKIYTEKWAAKSVFYTTEYLDISPVDKKIQIYSDLEKIKEVLSEILQNAGKFSQANSQVAIKISQVIKEEQKFIKIEVKNLGSGISNEEQKLVFDPFFQGANVPHASNRGFGIGLTKVKCLIELLKGTVEIHSFPIPEKQISETCITLNIPESQ